jgi:hypothetical protein
MLRGAPASTRFVPGSRPGSSRRCS